VSSPHVVPQIESLDLLRVGWVHARKKIQGCGIQVLSSLLEVIGEVLSDCNVLIFMVKVINIVPVDSPHHF
jgi:hypothetical protein